MICGLALNFYVLTEAINTETLKTPEFKDHSDFLFSVTSFSNTQELLEISWQQYLCDPQVGGSAGAPEYSLGCVESSLPEPRLHLVGAFFTGWPPYTYSISFQNFHMIKIKP